MTIDMQQTEAFAGQVVGDVAAALSGVMTNLGHKLGLYKAMAWAGPMSSDELAKKTGLHERYVREWLGNQAAGGYVTYNEVTNSYILPDAHIPVLADENSPLFLIPALEVAASLWLDEDKIRNVFHTGEGIAWGEHHHRLFCGTESLFRPGYGTFLTTEWIGAIPGLKEKLQAGAKIADVGCGYGASSILMARDFPNSTVHGFDFHTESIETARLRAQEAEAGDNLHFSVAAAKSYEDTGFDLICFLDCLHDMGDPVGAARHAREALNPDGSILLVEPAAGDSVSENINPVSRLYYAASTAVCTPCSRSQEVKTALGAQAGRKKLAEILGEAGFGEVNCVASTPFNIILEARVA
ncbi:class I SAM-dependent methyltransferase [Emcibacter sp.]|uniref:class I SAM-dependent methyltransferase n=1 Tax=Emcibacter sp. TaxID=1979954 RepID=UPI003A8DFC08